MKIVFCISISLLSSLILDVLDSASDDKTNNETSSPTGCHVRLGDTQITRSVQVPPCIQEGIRNEYRFKASLKQRLEGYSDRREGRAQLLDDWSKMFEESRSDGGNGLGELQVWYVHGVGRS